MLEFDVQLMTAWVTLCGEGGEEGGERDGGREGDRGEGGGVREI